MNGIKSQISMEYVLIIAFSLLIAIPLTIIFFQYSQTYNDDVVLSQVNSVMDTILASAEEIYYLGEPSQKTITVYLPESVEEITFSNGYFSFKMNSGGNTYTLYRSANINFTGNMSRVAGARKITIKAVNNTVQIFD
ncbi:MAG: hypothetical protein QXK76_03845 [Candidatus Woesearchaeota archaeon]